MDKDLLIKRLCELTLQDYNGYISFEQPAVLQCIKDELQDRITYIESEVPKLESEYRVLVSDKNSDNNRRMEVYDLKLKLSQEIDELKRVIQNKDALVIISRKRYSETVQLQESLKEQREICIQLWGQNDKA